MAKITSKAGLVVGTELTVDTTNKIITLNVAGNLVAKDGVSWQALYSKFVDLWTTATYNDFPFPFYALDVLSGQFLMGTDGSTYNGWKFSIVDSNASRGYMRDGGWSEYNAAGTLARTYAGIISLGTVSSGSQLYYQTTSTGAATNFIYTDAANQGVQVYGDAAADAATTTFNTQTFFKGYVREYGKKYKDSVLADTGKTGTGANIVNLLLSNETDLDILKTDAFVAAAFPITAGADSGTDAVITAVGSTAKTITAAVWTDATTTTFTSAAHTFVAGQTVSITGVTPSGYNTLAIITSVPTANTFTVTIAVNPGTYTSGGSAQITHGFVTGDYVNISGVVPTTYNGNFLVTASTATTFTVANPAVVSAWTSGGTVSSIYSMINVKYFPTAFNKDIDTSGTPRAFGIVVDVGTYSGVDGAGANAALAMTTTAAGITIADYYGGTLTIHNGAAKGTYTVSGTGGSASSVPITTGLLGIASGASFTLQRAAPIPASLQQIYTKVQYVLRQNTNINGLASAGAVTGKTASQTLNFVGSALKAGFYAPTNPNGGGTGVTLMGYASSDVNTFTSYDNTAATRDYPYASAGIISSNANLTSGSTGYYRMYFTTNPAGNYGSATAVTVNNAAGSPIAGTITSGSIAFTYDYTGNVQGGRTGGADAAVTLVLGNPGKSKPVVVTGTLTASKAISLSATGETERSYV
jgi:hypothetical protein